MSPASPTAIAPSSLEKSFSMSMDADATVSCTMT